MCMIQILNDFNSKFLFLLYIYIIIIFIYFIYLLYIFRNLFFSQKDKCLRPFWLFFILFFTFQSSKKLFLYLTKLLADCFVIPFIYFLFYTKLLKTFVNFVFHGSLVIDDSNHLFRFERSFSIDGFAKIEANLFCKCGNNFQ